MGRSSREKPTRLAEKLTQIRKYLGLSQDGILRQMELDERLNRDDISKYERGIREPSLIVLFKYARMAGVCVDVLIDDEVDLPQRLPIRPKHRGMN
jgi:transcriptional regulator with XRE-family HTH domain